MEEQKTNLYEELTDAFDETYIRNIGTLIHSYAETFINHEDPKYMLSVNETIFAYCLIDILVDLKRLRHFHNIDYVNYNKLIAYTASWWIKRKPIQLSNVCDERIIYINEKFALSLLIEASKTLDKTVKIAEGANKECVKKLDNIFYHLKYRNTNPQTLELLLQGISFGLDLIVSE